MKKPAPTENELTFPENGLIVSKTDTKGRITYGNKLFMELAKYSERELIGAPHNIVRHPDMPRTIFWYLWDRITKGKEIFAYVKNLSADGSYYWVLANVTPSFDSRGQIIGYYSVRRKPDPNILKERIIPLYKELLEAEKSGGLEGGKRYIEEILSKGGVSYEEFIASL